MNLGLSTAGESRFQKFSFFIAKLGRCRVVSIAGFGVVLASVAVNLTGPNDRACLLGGGLRPDLTRLTDADVCGAAFAVGLKSDQIGVE